MNNKRKKDIVKFIVGGIVALALAKAEKFIDKKTDEHFPDEETDQEDN